MLCANCGTEKATTGEGLCDGCVIAAANSAPPPRAPVVPLSGPTAVLRSPVGLSYAVMALLGAVIAADCFSLFASFRLRGQMSALTSGDLSGLTTEEAELSDALMAASTFLYVFALLATATVFIVWFFRVRRNAGVFAPDVPRRGSGWAIGAWFIPFANLWIPRGIAVDVWSASRRDPYSLEAAKEEPHTVLNAWWTAWVVSALFDRFAANSYKKAEAPDEIRDALDLMVAGDLLDIAAAVLAVFFVRALTRMQHLKATTGPADSTDPATERPVVGRM
ncbi:DUF4328 domain-containing protein [Streptomyces sp. NPDC002994]|uniref:DUF4328 domain-containing protein n=1 Tax=Streptomyces sp. NPDC002994 TaxID=3154441 RepID=UPI0033B06253